MTGIAALCGVLLGLGVVLLARGMTPAPPALRAARTRPRLRLRRSDIVLLALGLTGGVLALVATGWIVLLIAVPVAVAGLPALLRYPVNRDIELLEALDRWIRALGATLPTGQSVVEAIRTTGRSAPPSLHVDQTIARLDQRWTPREALLAMADDLDSPDADAVLAALMLAAERGGTGATSAMNALADSVQARLRVLREIEGERSKPRIVVRQVTVVSVVVLAGALVFGRSFFAPYATPVGQAILGALLAVYVASLVVLRTMTLPRRRERILALPSERPARSRA